jgi:hypothetical protein
MSQQISRINSGPQVSLGLALAASRVFRPAGDGSGSMCPTTAAALIERFAPLLQETLSECMPLSAAQAPAAEAPCLQSA